MMNEQRYETNSPEETQNLASKLLLDLPSHIVTLKGNLGSGKTTFVQGIAKALGISRRVNSPTFIIMRSYRVAKSHRFQMLYHIDLYRITDEKDIEGLGVGEIIQDKKNLILIEWPEKISGLLPGKRMDISFEYVDENKRRIVI